MRVSIWVHVRVRFMAIVLAQIRVTLMVRVRLKVEFSLQPKQA